VDVWSCGILMYTFLCGTFPFKALSEKELFTKISKGIFNIPTYLSNEAKNLLKRILVINPDKRPLAGDVISLFM
jgi:carbon catabolite-derepressing protein kinase